jgi:hypothetical protein
MTHPQQTFYQREIVYETGLSLQAVQRELKNLLHLGILKKRETKAKVYYQIDPSSPWFNPLKEIYAYALAGSNYPTRDAAIQDLG